MVCVNLECSLLVCSRGISGDRHTQLVCLLLQIAVVQDWRKAFIICL